MALIAKRLLVLTVWRLGRWYIRRRAPRARRVAARGLAGLGALAALGAALRRLAA